MNGLKVRRMLPVDGKHAVGSFVLFDQVGLMDVKPTMRTPNMKKLLIYFLPAVLLLSMASAVQSQDAKATTAPVQAAGHITGIGGIFFKAKDPKTLAAWYRDVLGMPLEAWGGAMLRYDAPQHPSLLTWSAFPAATKYFAPSNTDFMINYAVDDMDALILRLNVKGVDILKRDDTDANGRFAWILDPEGNKIELWQSKVKASQ